MPASAALTLDDPRLEPCPVETIPGSIRTGILILCDHASNAVPPDLGDLGLPASEFERHIAYDIGAAAVTRSLARRLGAPAILTRFSRLVIDPNRGRDDPTLVMRLSDGAVVPGNARVDEAEVQRRIARFYDPYDDAIADAIHTAMAAGHPPVVVTVHSFTPVWRGWPRPWHVGILWDADERFAKPLLEGLAAEDGLVVGNNEPYDGALAGDTVDRHATVRGLANALIEIRQDLIASEAGAEEWAERFARLLEPLAGRAELREPRIFGTRTRDRLRQHGG
ncbi:N-formylglutamate amidohydrolase [Microvirga sesbaniae]|uniref:N-formylglutamate amidohydrolase n=1 Tax=Microvirga sesbaniae TaxID=681392 RepID=UPI0021C790C3|nr:N-formylglutamate amidohydrolase [Microvirga sp. HBU67692]